LLKQTAVAAPQHRYLDSIVREARRLEASLADVLTQTEALHPSVDSWDINRLLAQVVAGLKEDFALFGVACRLDLASGLPPVRLDLKVMSHCLRALLGHAMEGAPVGETVTVGTLHEADSLRIVIGDHTPPPDAEELAAIAVAGSDVADGRDLFGLALCARLLAGQQARLDFTPDANGGTQYTITIPITEEDAHGTTAGG
jgi:signal transduction histidine kinase